MKFLLDLFPVLAFFIAFKMAGDSESGIITATAVLMIAVLIQMSVYWLLYKRLEKMHLITFVAVVIFGGATLLLHDERFIQWKPTIVLWIFASIVFASQYIGKKNLFQRVMQYSNQQISAPTPVWLRLNTSLAIFLALLGASNLYVAYNFDRSTWVDFKVFGIAFLNLIFIVGAMFYMFRHADMYEDTSPGEVTEKEDSNSTPAGPAGE